MPPRRKPNAPRKPDSFPAERVLTGCDVSGLHALGSELEHFHFVGGEFGGADLSGLRFEDCLFERCNLASARLRSTALRNVAFADCKLLGVTFSECDEMSFSVHFDECQLRYASFVGRRMPGTRFVKCSLVEADFTDADLGDAGLADCDLTRAVFHHTRLTGTDFTTAWGFSLDPASNTVRGARFTLGGLPGLLTKYGVVIE